MYAVLPAPPSLPLACMTLTQHHAACVPVHDPIFLSLSRHILLSASLHPRHCTAGLYLRYIAADQR